MAAADANNNEKTSSHSDYSQDGLLDRIRNLPALLQEKALNQYRKITNTDPLPKDFPFDYMLESYMWRTVFLTALTLGFRFGATHVIGNAFLGIFGSYLIFAIEYIAFPVALYHYTSNEKALTVPELRVVLIAAAFVMGLVGAAFNHKFVLSDPSPPFYFLPFLVSLCVQLLGPNFADDRTKLVPVCVGSALTLAIALSAANGELAIIALLFLVYSAVMAAINMQILFADIINKEADMMKAHMFAIIMSIYQHLLLIRILGDHQGKHVSNPLTAVVMN